MASIGNNIVYDSPERRKEKMKQRIKSMLLVSLWLVGVAQYANALAEKPPDSFSFVQISDTHIYTSSQAIPPSFKEFKGDENHAERLRVAVKEINRMQPKPAFVIATGDLVHEDVEKGLTWPNLEGYKLFKEIMEQLTMPWYPVPGNHDQSEAYKKILGFPPCYSFDYGNCHFIVLDSNADLPAPWHGHIDSEQFEWLKADLDKNKDRPTMLFFHQPMLPIGDFPGMLLEDEDLVDNADEIFELLSKYPRANWVITGHFHVNKLYKHQKVFHVITGQTCSFGGYNGPPPGYRIVNIDGMQITTRYKILGGELEPISKPEDFYPPPYIPKNLAGSAEQTKKATESKAASADMTDAKPVLFMHFDQESGNTVYDSSGYDNHGQLRNMDDTNWIEGISDNALFFDGKDDYVEVPHSDSMEFTDEITLEAWVKFNEVGPLHRIFVKKDSFHMTLEDGSKRIYFQIVNEAGKWSPLFYSKTAFLANRWYYLVGTYDGETAKLYVDGEYESGVPFSGRINTTDNNLILGILLGGPGLPGPLHGTLDEVRILRQCLYPDEIKNGFEQLHPQF